jgi:transcriptional regulator with XRE-family HTH domain
VPPSRYQLRRQELGQALRTLRVQAGLSGPAFADRLGEGWWQTRVSKIERGVQLPTEEDVRAWVVAAGVPDVSAAVGHLAELLRAARGEREDFQQAYRRAGGAAGRQAEYAELEKQATQIREFVPVMIPSLLMTAGYAEQALRAPSGPLALGGDEGELDRLLEERMKRQDILWNREKQVQIVILEAALYTRLVGDPGVMLGQLDRLLALEGLPALELTIVPFSAVVPVYPLTGFVIFDDDSVLIETLTGDEPIGDPEHVAQYIRWLDLLRESGVRGREAAALILRARAGLRPEAE